MGKRKSEVNESENEGSDDKKVNWEDLVAGLHPIAKPLAPKKLTKKLYKAVKKGQKQKHLRKGVREVQKFIRKGEKGIVILAGDTSPIDVISHMAVLCEENNLPYCYVTSKEDLGAACGSRRQTCAVMLKSHEEYKDKYKECKEEVSTLPMPF